MVQLIKRSSTLLILSFCFLLSCTNSSNPTTTKNKITFPQEGVQCYKTNQEEDITHLKISILEKEIEGVILLNDEVWGNIFYDFSGEVINDSLYQIFIHFYQDKSEQEWTLKINNDYLEISGIWLYEEKLQLTVISCDEFPDISLYYSDEDIWNESEAEALENPDLICFYMYYPGGMKRKQIEEYIELRNRNGELSGLGAGSSEGEPDWSFNFKGHFTQGDTAEITVVYKQEGRDSFISHETWIINLQENTLKLDKNKPIDLRVLGDGEFFVVDCSGVGEWAKELMKNHPMN